MISGTVSWYRSDHSPQASFNPSVIAGSHFPATPLYHEQYPSPHVVDVWHSLCLVFWHCAAALLVTPRPVPIAATHESSLPVASSATSAAKHVLIENTNMIT